MTEREEEIRQIMKAERQRQLGELIENIIHGIPTGLKYIGYAAVGYISVVLLLCVCG